MGCLPCFQRERDPTSIPNPFKKPQTYLQDSSRYKVPYEYHTAICTDTPNGKKYWIIKDKLLLKDINGEEIDESAA